MIPSALQFLLLSLAAYRAWRLIAEDDITDGLRARVTRLGKDKKITKEYREKLALFINCPWCAGAWVSLIAYICFLGTIGEWPDTAGDVVVGIGVWFALSASVGLIRTNLDEPEEDEE